MTDKPLNVMPPAGFTIWPYVGGGMDPTDARRYIRTLLANQRIGFTPELVSPDRLGGQVDVIGKAVVAGTTNVKCFYDGTDNTGEIRHGASVVFDTTTGLAVTGINPKWTPDQYKVVGTAMGEYRTPNPGAFGIIQMTIKEDQPLPEGPIIARAAPAPGLTWPTMFSWCDADPGVPGSQEYVWTAELPADLSFNPQTGYGASFGLGGNVWQGSGEYVYIYNLTRQYVHMGAYLEIKPAGATARQYYCEYYMTPSVIAKLLEILKEGNSANAELITSSQQGINGTFIKVDDRMLKDGQQLKKDQNVWCSLYRYTAGAGLDFVWRWGAVQSVECPEKQPTSP